MRGGFESVAAEMEGVRLRAALGEAMRLASEVNKYLDTHAPWKAVKTDKAAAGRTIFTAIQAINDLKTLFAPFLPFSSQTLHTNLGFEGILFGTQSVEAITDDLGKHNALRYHPESATGRWESQPVPAGHAFNKPTPLFQKLDPTIVEEERARLG